MTTAQDCDLFRKFTPFGNFGTTGTNADNIIIDFGPEIPQSFIDGMNDILAGLTVDIDVAHFESPEQ